MTVRVNKGSFNIREKLTELGRRFGLKGSELIAAETAQEARDLVSAGRRNLIMNGNMSVWQRGTAASTITTGGAYLADRWQVATAGTAQLTHEQSTDAPPGFNYSLKVSPSVADTLSSTEQIHITQQIEAQNLTFLNWGTSELTPITISFWAKSNDTSNKALWIYAQDANDHIARQFNCKQANTWEKFTFTIPGNPLGVINNDNGVGIYVRIVLDAGGSVANGGMPDDWATLSSLGRYGNMGRVFATSTSNEFYLTGVQVEAGKNATDFEYRSFGEELALCQRYYLRLNAEGNNHPIANVYGESGSQVYGTFHFPVQMRAAPTFSYSGTSSHFTVTGIGNATSGPTMFNATLLTAGIGANTSGNGTLALYGASQLRFTNSSAWIEFYAEY